MERGVHLCLFACSASDMIPFILDIRAVFISLVRPSMLLFCRITSVGLWPKALADSSILKGVCEELLGDGALGLSRLESAPPLHTFVCSSIAI